MNSSSYRVLDDGDLQLSRNDQAYEWRGRVDGMPASGVTPAPDGSFAIVLLEPPTGPRAVTNLVKFSSSAVVVWRGELPPGHAADCFVAFDLQPDLNVRASTWSGFRVLLCGDTGRLLEQVFTK